jgi:hypothetical protein
VADAYRVDPFRRAGFHSRSFGGLDANAQPAYCGRSRGPTRLDLERRNKKRSIRYRTNDPYLHTNLYYWAREARTSNAEVDYLVPFGSHALPLEVKAGKSGTLRSLHQFLHEHPASLGIRVSQSNQQVSESLFSLPLYAIQGLSKGLGTLLSRTPQA